MELYNINSDGVWKDINVSAQTKMIYSIDNIKRHFVDPDNLNSIRYQDLEGKGYNLHNENVYFPNGKLYKEYTQKQYDTYFAAMLEREGNLSKHEIKPFLEHHFQYTPDKKYFLEHLEFYIIPDYIFDKNEVRLKIITDWINEKKQSLIVPAGKQIEKITNDEINVFCKSMPLDIPKEHFRIFTEKRSKNMELYLSIEQYNSFIERAFKGNNELPKQKFNQTPKGEKLLIQSVFYEFYNNYCFDYFNTMQCQDNFIKLLTENFEGWDFKNVQDNFTPKTKKRL